MTREVRDTVSPSVTRRGFLKTVAAGGAACATTSTLASPVAADYDWKEALTDAAVYSVTGPTMLGVDYLMGTDYVNESETMLANYIHRRFGDMRDYGGYTGADALMTEIQTGAAEMALSDEKVMTSIQNNIQAANNVAYSKGQIAVAEALNAGKSESQANTDMENAVKAHFSSIQTNVLNHYVTQCDQLAHHGDEIVNHSGTQSINNYYEIKRNGSGWWSGSSTDYYYPMIRQASDATSTTVENVSMTLLDGTSYTGIPVAYGGNTDYEFGKTPHSSLIPSANTQEPAVYRVHADADFTNSDYAQYFNTNSYMNAMSAIEAEHDSVISDLSGYVTDVYSAYNAGELDLTDVIDPTTYATEMAADNNDEAFRQAAAAQGGFPTAATENVVITITTTDSSGSEVSETIRTDLYTQHTPTDSNGNEVGFEVGQTYDPSTWAEPLFITYRRSSDGNQTMGQLTDTFTIEEAYDPDGNNVTTFKTEETTTHTSNVQELQNQLDQLRQEQLRLQEQASNTTPDSDGTGAVASDGPGILGWMDNNLGIGPIPGRAVGLGSIGAAGYGVYSSTVSAASNAGPSINVGGNGPDK